MYRSTSTQGNRTNERWYTIPSPFSFFFSFFPSHLLSSRSFSLSLNRNSDPGGSHSRLFSPLPTAVRAFHPYREKTSSLVDSHRIVPTHARHSAVDPFLISANTKSRHLQRNNPRTIYNISMVYTRYYCRAGQLLHCCSLGVTM